MIFNMAWSEKYAWSKVSPVQTDEQACGQADRQTDRQTGRETNNSTETVTL